MKWALLALACVSLLLCYMVGVMAAEVNAWHSGYTSESLGIINTAAVSTYSAGAIAAGLIGAVSAFGAALIQVSENKRKD